MSSLLQKLKQLSSSHNYRHNACGLKEIALEYILRNLNDQVINEGINVRSLVVSDSCVAVSLHTSHFILSAFAFDVRESSNPSPIF